jgi:hypothetical protein
LLGVDGTVSQAGPTAEEVWRNSLPPGKRPGLFLGLAGTALTVVLLIASGVVI